MKIIDMTPNYGKKSTTNIEELKQMVAKCPIHVVVKDPTLRLCEEMNIPKVIKNHFEDKGLKDDAACAEALLFGEIPVIMRSDLRKVDEKGKLDVTKDYGAKAYKTKMPENYPTYPKHISNSRGTRDEFCVSEKHEIPEDYEDYLVAKNVVAKYEDKYYTPSSREFEVGFIYESNRPDPKYPNHWRETTIENWVQLRQIDMGNTQARRVRKLSSHCFRQEGFHQSGGSASVFTPGNATYTNEETKMRIKHVPSLKLVTIWAKDGMLGFHGEIKNRSELKKIINKIP